jgi:hypothetical protein
MCNKDYCVNIECISVNNKYYLSLLYWNWMLTTLRLKLRVQSSLLPAYLEESLERLPPHSPIVHHALRAWKYTYIYIYCVLLFISQQKVKIKGLYVSARKQINYNSKLIKTRISYRKNSTLFPHFTWSVLKHNCNCILVYASFP